MSVCESLRDILVSRFPQSVLWTFQSRKGKHLSFSCRFKLKVNWIDGPTEFKYDRGILPHLQIPQKWHRHPIFFQGKGWIAMRPKLFVQHLPLQNWQWRRILDDSVDWGIDSWFCGCPVHSWRYETIKKFWASHNVKVAQNPFQTQGYVFS